MKNVKVIVSVILLWSNYSRHPLLTYIPVITTPSDKPAGRFGLYHWGCWKPGEDLQGFLHTHSFGMKCWNQCFLGSLHAASDRPERDFILVVGKLSQAWTWKGFLSVLSFNLSAGRIPVPVCGLDVLIVLESWLMVFMQSRWKLPQAVLANICL